MIRRVTSTIVDGTEEPVSVADMQTWSRGTIGSDTDTIQEVITASRDLFERITGRNLVLKSNVLYIDSIPGGTLPWWSGVRDGARTAEQGNSIDLILPPAVEITQISTYDVDNVAHVWDADNYFLDNTDPEQVPRVCLNIGAFWPTNLRPRDALKIEFTSGYGEDFPIPASMKMALKMMVLYAFNNRGDCSESGACSCGAMGLLRPFVLVDVMPRQEDGRARGLHSSYDGAFNDG